MNRFRLIRSKNLVLFAVSLNLIVPQMSRAATPAEEIASDSIGVYSLVAEHVASEDSSANARAKLRETMNAKASSLDVREVGANLLMGLGGTAMFSGIMMIAQACSVRDGDLDQMFPSLTSMSGGDISSAVAVTGYGLFAVGGGLSFAAEALRMSKNDGHLATRAEVEKQLAPVVTQTSRIYSLAPAKAARFSTLLTNEAGFSGRTVKIGDLLVQQALIPAARKQAVEQTFQELAATRLPAKKGSAAIGVRLISAWMNQLDREITMLTLPGAQITATERSQLKSIQARARRVQQNSELVIRLTRTNRT